MGNSQSAEEINKEIIENRRMMNEAVSLDKVEAHHVQHLEEINKEELERLIQFSLKHEEEHCFKDIKIIQETMDHAIKFLETQPTRVWQNAELEIIDKSGEMITLRSGNGENKFTLHYDGDDQIRFCCRGKENWCKVLWKRSSVKKRKD